MRLSFDSIEEVKEFVKGLKGTRGGKGGSDDEGAAGGAGTPATGTAPPPAMPPQGGAMAGFAPPANFAPQGGAAPGNFPGATAVDPAVAGIVQRIAARIDGAIASGQPADNVLAWFRQQCGPEAAQATLDQVKGHFLHKLAMPSLEQIAKLMNA